MSPPPSDRGLLVIVACGSAKIWKKHPEAGPTAAARAYIGAPFTVNRRYAEASGGDWMVLSAKYGFLLPTDSVPGPFEVTFKRPATNPIGFDPLRQQVRQKALDRYREVVGLGFKDYREAIEAAFTGTSVTPHFPFAGLSLFETMAATKRATAH